MKPDPRPNSKKIVKGHPERVDYSSWLPPDPRPDSQEERVEIWTRHFGQLQKEWGQK